MLSKSLNNFLPSILDTSSKSPVKHQVHQCKSLVFAIAHYQFALPVFAIQKIIRLEPETATAIRQNGFFMLDQSPIVVVDVSTPLEQPTNFSTQTITLSRHQSSHRHVERHNSEHSTSHEGHLLGYDSGLSSIAVAPPVPVPCLLLVQSTDGPRWALQVASLPQLIEIPLSSIHPIASTYPNPILQLAQCMAIMTPDSTSTFHSFNDPIFLLDLKRVQPVTD